MKWVHVSVPPHEDTRIRVGYWCGKQQLVLSEPVCLGMFVSVCLSRSVCLGLSVSVCLSRSVCLCMSLSVSVYVCIGLGRAGYTDEHTHGVYSAGSPGLRSRHRERLRPKPHGQSYTRYHLVSIFKTSKAHVLDSRPSPS